MKFVFEVSNLYLVNGSFKLYKLANNYFKWHLIHKVYTFKALVRPYNILSLVSLSM